MVLKIFYNYYYNLFNKMRNLTEVVHVYFMYYQNIE